jgi:hypothetical protein
MESKSNGNFPASKHLIEPARQMKLPELPVIKIHPVEMMAIMGKTIYQLTTIMYRTPKIGEKFQIIAVNFPDGNPTGMMCTRYVVRVEELPQPTMDESYYNIWLSPYQIDCI